MQSTKLISWTARDLRKIHRMPRNEYNVCAHAIRRVSHAAHQC